MIAFPVLMIVAGAVLRLALGDASNGYTDVIGVILIAVGTVGWPRSSPPASGGPGARNRCRVRIAPVHSLIDRKRIGTDR